MLVTAQLSFSFWLRLPSLGEVVVLAILLDLGIVRSGFTAAATLAGSVQGVVVQTSRYSSGRSSSGKRT